MASDDDKSYVWVVTHNEDYEGGYVTGIYHTQKKAVFNAEIIAVKASHDRKVIVTNRDDIIEYKWGCDYVQVEKFEVE